MSNVIFGALPRIWTSRAGFRLSDCCCARYSQISSQKGSGTGMLDGNGTTQLAITLRNLGHVTIVSARGEIDLATAPLLEEGVDEALAQSPSAVIIDLSDVEFLASMGMNVLVSARRRAGSATAVTVVADGPHTRRPMDLVGLSGAIPIYTDLPAALDAAGAHLRSRPKRASGTDCSLGIEH